MLQVINAALIGNNLSLACTHARARTPLAPPQVKCLLALIECLTVNVKLVDFIEIKNFSSLAFLVGLVAIVPLVPVDQLDGEPVG